MSDQSQSSGLPAHDKDITLRDVVNQILLVEQRLLGEIKKNSENITKNGQDIEKNTQATADLKAEMNQRFDAVDRDLRAIAMDTVEIRKHVGMPLPSQH